MMENDGSLERQPLRCLQRQHRDCGVMQKRRTLSIRFIVLCLAASLGLSLLWARPSLAQNGGLNGGLDEPFDTLDASAPVYEPSVLEPFNEQMFSFNMWMDRHILRPVARVYIGTVPEKGRLGVQRFFKNIGVVFFPTSGYGCCNLLLCQDCLINNNFLKLYKKFSPGPITYILNLTKNSKISKITTNKKSSLAVRFPKHKVTRKLLNLLIVE